MRILGIDVGSTSVKAVEIDSAFGRYEIHDYHEIARSPSLDAAATLAQLRASLSKVPDKIIVALPTSQVTFRNLHLPTRDRKAIMASVGFELEDELPFELEDAVYDYSMIGQTKNSTSVHVSATLRKHLIAQLSTWTIAGIEPDVISSESWAYRAVLNRVLLQGASAAPTRGPKPKEPVPTQDPVLLAQIGHERTTIYVHWQGVPQLARELSWGGRDLTAAICQKYQIPVEQAEAAKLDHGFVVPQAQRGDATPDQVEFSDTLLEPLERLQAALKQAELSAKNLTHRPLSQVYLSGGTSLLPGLAKVIEERMNIPARPLQALSSIATSGVTYSEQTDAQFLLATALGLSLVGPDRTIAVNFRKGEFAKTGGTREINWKTLRRPLLACAAIAACFFASLFVQSRVYDAKLKETDEQLEKSVRTFFTAISSGALRTYLSNTSALKTAVNKELTKQRETTRLLGPNPHSPTEFLRELSMAVPTNVIVDMTNYQVGSSAATNYSPTEPADASLSFIVANPQLAERLSPILGGKLAALQRSKMEEVTMPDGTKRWKITFSGKPSEDSYGK